MRPGGTDRRLWIGFLALAMACSGEPTPAPPPPWEGAPDEPVGAARCASCHTGAAAAWTGSHHDRALEVAGPDTVLGAFDGSRVTGMGQSATFSRDGDAYVVETQGFDGAPGRFEVSYTFGIDPIQQVLVKFPGGAVQVLPWLWEPAGKRWLALYPDEAIPPGDALHWAGPNQRWNTRCADCHSTGVHEGYDPATATYATTWTDEDVACEACHGNGSRHVAWADAGAQGTDPGVPVRLSEEAAWEMDPSRGIARRVPARTDHVEVDTCGRCHSRRLTISEAPPSGQSLLDTHRVAVLDPDLYEADGQIHDEVYEWGSFVQSPMYAAGVTCTDCHDPHSGRLRGEGDAVCARCHLPERFAVPAHTHHTAVGCVDCHMPPRTYMVVDERRDHSMRVPRPDLSVAIGVPEPCTRCHPDRDAAWAAAAVMTWFPAGRTGTPHYAEALQAGRTRAPDAPDRLVALAGDPATPAIVRATAVSLLARYPAPSVPGALRAAVRDLDPLVRREAATAGRLLPLEERARMFGPLLDDPVLGVRLAAVEVVAGATDLRPDVAEDLAQVVAEARSVHRLHADRPEAWIALGDLDAALGDAASAESEYRAALALDPRAVPARVNLADLLRATGRDADAVTLLGEGLGLLPENAGLHHALGLALVRTGDRAAALTHLERAAAIEPGEARYAYVYAVALSSAGRAADAEAFAALAYERSPGDPDLLVLLEGFAAARGDAEASLAWRTRAMRDAPWAFGP